MQHKYSYPEDRYILIGIVGKAQGLRGEVNIRPFSDQPDNLEAYDTLVLVDKAGKLSPKLKIIKFRVQKGKAIILFDQIVDRTHAEKLAGMGVLLAREGLPELAEDEFYWHQLIGLSVRSLDGRDLGTLLSVFSNGAQDIMVIGDEEHEFLVPMTTGIIVEQNDSQFVIDPPPGLLEINAGDEETGNDYPA